MEAEWKRSLSNSKKISNHGKKMVKTDDKGFKSIHDNYVFMEYYKIQL